MAVLAIMTKNMTNTTPNPMYCSRVNDSLKRNKSAKNWKIVYVKANGCSLPTWLLCTALNLNV